MKTRPLGSHCRLAVAAVACLASVVAGPAAAQAPHQKGAAFNMVAVGHNDLDGRGFNADVWVHEGHAYVGSWGFSDFASGSKKIGRAHV